MCENLRTQDQSPISNTIYRCGHTYTTGCTTDNIKSRDPGSVSVFHYLRGQYKALSFNTVFCCNSKMGYRQKGRGRGKLWQQKQSEYPILPFLLCFLCFFHLINAANATASCFHCCCNCKHSSISRSCPNDVTLITFKMK